VDGHGMDAPPARAAPLIVSLAYSAAYLAPHIECDYTVCTSAWVTRGGGPRGWIATFGVYHPGDDDEISRERLAFRPRQPCRSRRAETIASEAWNGQETGVRSCALQAGSYAPEMGKAWGFREPHGVRGGRADRAPVPPDRLVCVADNGYLPDT